MAAAIGLATVGACAALSAPAGAATYPVLACGPSGGANLSWTFSNTSPTLTGSQICPAPAQGFSGLLVTDVLDGSQTPAGARAEWTFTAPPGLVISAVSGQRWLLTQLDDDWVAYIRDGSGRHLEECRTGPGLAVCQSAGALYPPESVPFRYEGLAADSISIGVACTGGGCGNGLGRHFAGASLRDVRVDLEDAVPAAVTAQTGSLVGAGGAWIRGTHQLTVTGADAGGGVSALGVALAQGTTVRIGEHRPLLCDYVLKIPCPGTATAGLQIDTRALPDGEHVTRAYADDATAVTSLANRGLGPAFVVRVDNTPPPPPGLAAPPAVAGAPIAAVASLPPQAPGAPIAAVEWSLTPDDGGTGARGGQGLPGPLAGVGASRPGPWTLAARARDAAGNLGPEARLALAVAPAPQEPGSGLPPPPPPGPELRNAEVARPVAGRRVRELRPRLSWPRVGGARGYQVHLLWVRPDGSLRRVSQERVRSARYRPRVGPIRSGRRYVWRVWPLRAGGRPGTLFVASTFEVGLGFARPRAGTVTRRLRPVLRWRAPAGVRLNEVRLYRVGPGGRGLRPVARARVSAERYRVPPGALRPGRYLWLVRPVRAGRAAGPLVTSAFFTVRPRG